jgi:hypothetical protein
MSIRIVKQCDGHKVRLFKIIDGVEIQITDPGEFAHYMRELDKIDNGDEVAGRKA